MKKLFQILPIQSHLSNLRVGFVRANKLASMNLIFLFHVEITNYDGLPTETASNTEATIIKFSW